MRTFLVLAALGWAMSLPWAALFDYIVLIVAAIAILWGLSLSIEHHAATPRRDRKIIDQHYVAALESIVVEAEAEIERLRASCVVSEPDPRAALYGRVGLSPRRAEMVDPGGVARLSHPTSS